MVRNDSELDEAYQLVEKQECVAEQYLDIQKEVSLTVTIEMNNKQHTFLFKKMNIKIKYYLKQSFQQDLIKKMKRKEVENHSRNSFCGNLYSRILY